MSGLAWEEEYRKRSMLSVDAKPLASVKTFLRWLKKQGVDRSTLTVLDLGSGTGRNVMHLAKEGATVTGIEIAPTAVRIARERAREADVTVTYLEQSMAKPWPITDASIDLVLDVTSSNALLSAERQTYLQELARVTKPGAHLFLRTLAVEGDKNAKQLLKDHPGPEPGTYRMPGLHIVERVFTRQEIQALYTNFEIMLLKKEMHYPTIDGKRFKRAYWIGYLRRKGN